MSRDELTAALNEGLKGCSEKPGSAGKLPWPQDGSVCLLLSWELRASHWNQAFGPGFNSSLPGDLSQVVPSALKAFLPDSEACFPNPKAPGGCPQSGGGLPEAPSYSCGRNLPLTVTPLDLCSFMHEDLREKPRLIECHS